MTTTPDVLYRPKPFSFSDLFVFEMANNHQGSVEHGLRIIRAMGTIAKARGVRAAVKLQFRHLESFVHPAHLAGSANKHIGRFLATRLTPAQFGALVQETVAQGLVTMCTPFDEPSLDLIDELDIQVIKIGSCSATDWPLLEAVAARHKPVIFSVGGLTLKQIDQLVSFFDHRRVHHAIMHCVSLYPTPPDRLQLNQIELLRRRYPDKVVGFSTHEEPNDLAPVQVAVAKGAGILERHVGIAAEGITLNAYSSTPEQIDRWIGAALAARTICGATTGRVTGGEEEARALTELMRGVYARHSLLPGQRLTRADVYFAMPCAEGQLPAGQWKAGIEVAGGIDRDGPLNTTQLRTPHNSTHQVLYDAIHTIKGMLHEANIRLSTEFRAEFSHHFGVSEFPRVGATIIDCVNREYCKKIVIVMPGQYHPSHFHKRKEETFQVLHGTLDLVVEGRRRTLYPGDTQLVQQGVWHEFWSEAGAIFEEVSTTHHNDDSFYEDKTIARKTREERKTVVNNWGRYQLGETVREERPRAAGGPNAGEPHPMLSGIRCVVLDFDGTLVDSNAIKRDAFFQALAPLGAERSLIEQVLAAEPGDRTAIITAAVAALRKAGRVPGSTDGDQLVRRTVEEYTSRTDDAISRCAAQPDVSWTLPWLASRFPLYLWSDTPESSLQAIVERRGWAQHFRGMVGRPRSKAENLRAILARDQIDPSEVLVVGDTRRDLEAALECGCRFLGVRSDGNNFEPHGVVFIATMGELAGGSAPEKPR
ncbi:MAG: HAD hydrolase-like protein [Gemmatimonadales bacterium]|nr:HAD hydrolase-like protein [Gemmatimonadales bacterium]